MTDIDSGPMDSIYIPPNPKKHKKTLALRQIGGSNMIYFVDSDDDDRVTVVHCDGPDGWIRIRIMFRKEANTLWNDSRKKGNYEKMDPKVAYDFVHWMIKDLRDEPTPDPKMIWHDDVDEDIPIEKEEDVEHPMGRVIADGKMGMIYVPAGTDPDKVVPKSPIRDRMAGIKRLMKAMTKL